MIDRKATLEYVFPFLRWRHLVNKKSLRADFFAGLTGAIIVLPQGVAFAMIAGMPPVYGLYTAIVVPIIAALFGSSLHLISGPTTAISLLVFASVSNLAEPGSAEFVELALVLTFMAGVFQLSLGLARLGMLVNFVSHTVVIGFTAGAAVLIATSQIRHVLGIQFEAQENFLGAWTQIIQKAPETNPYVLAVGLGSLVFALLARRISKKSPHLLIAMILGATMAVIMGGESKGITFVQEIPAQLPPLVLPEFSIDNFRELSSSAFAIGLLGLIEAVAIARSIGVKTSQRLDVSQEFVGQGLSNVVGSFFSCYAGSGSFTRSGVNHTAGAQTPMAAIFAAVLLALFVLLFAPLATYLPMPAMGGIILLVAYNLIDSQHIIDIFKTSKKENAVLALTFFATLFLELEFAIIAGVFLSLVFYLQRTSRPHIATLAPDPNVPNRPFINIARKTLPECPQLKIVRIDGSLYYGAIEHVSAFLDELRLNYPQKRLLIIANGINFVDLPSAEWLVQETRRWREMGGDLYISGLKIVAQDVLLPGGYKEEIGEDHFFKTKKEAIAAIYAQLDPKICETCQVRIFKECVSPPPPAGDPTAPGRL
jgi:sulfate permease, SulP family